MFAADFLNKLWRCHRCHRSTARYKVLSQQGQEMGQNNDAGILSAALFSNLDPSRGLINLMDENNKKMTHIISVVFRLDRGSGQGGVNITGGPLQYQYQVGYLFIYNGIYNIYNIYNIYRRSSSSCTGAGQVGQLQLGAVSTPSTSSPGQLSYSSTATTGADI